MSVPSIRITFHPGSHTVTCLSGALLIEAAARAGLIIDTPCGGAGTCGKCKVRFETEAPSPTATEVVRLTAAERDAGWRLACQTRLLQDACIMAPPESLFSGQHQIQTTSDQDHIRRSADADIFRQYIETAPPALSDDTSDLLRLESALNHRLEGANMTGLTASLEVLRDLGPALRKAGFRGTATLRDNELIDFEPGDTAANAYALAFDIGTTTLVGALLQVSSGEDLAVASAMNPQTAYGDDVLSRIARTSQDDVALHEMQHCIVKAVRDMATALCAQAGVSTGHVFTVCVAGNTTMQQLFCGLSPASLGVVPFVPLFGRGLTVPAAALNLGVHPRAQTHVFPVIGGFVGGDTVAGLLATGMRELAGPALMVDIGTNGEIVLAHEGRLWAASAAAGPAFEGARISCGMRATKGAIEKVIINNDIEFGVIGGATPAGLCGSGLIDLCGELLKAGALGRDGRLKTGDETDGTLPEPVRARLRAGVNGEPECVLYESGSSRVSLTQRDVRELQLGAGAIRVGVRLLLKQTGLLPKDLKQVLIAGGFGSFIRRDNAQRIGLIPHELSHERIRFAGNITFSGAKWAALSRQARKQAEILARQTHHVDLSRDEDFALEFAMAMQFPEVRTGG